MSEWKTIDSAPKGEWVEISYNSNGKEMMRKSFKANSLIIWVKDQGWMRSKWIEEQSRWEGTSKEKNIVTHWLDISQPYGVSP